MSVLGWLGAATVLAICALAALLVLFSPAAFSNPRPSTASERTYLSASNPDKPQPLPSLLDDHDNNDADTRIALSVIVPAYNEQERLSAMLQEALDHLLASCKRGTWEILLVDDGSSDATSKVALAFAKSRAGSADFEPSCVRIVKLTKNRGKGGAVRHGMLHARGKRLLFCDADGASKFSDLTKLERELDIVISSLADSQQGATRGQRNSPTHATANGHANGPESSAKDATATEREQEPAVLIVGSRAHMMTSPAVVKRSKLRNLLMRAFHTYLAILGVASIKDTQCGFKLFTRAAAQAIFPSLHVEGWIFDIEILILASLQSVEVCEVPITWREIQGSKMSLVRDSVRMALDLLVIRASYAVGRWSIPRGRRARQSPYPT